MRRASREAWGSGRGLEKRQVQARVEVHAVQVHVEVQVRQMQSSGCCQILQWQRRGHALDQDLQADKGTRGCREERGG